MCHICQGAARRTEAALCIPGIKIHLGIQRLCKFWKTQGAKVREASPKVFGLMMPRRFCNSQDSLENTTKPFESTDSSEEHAGT